MLLSLINVKLNLDDISNLHLALQAVQDICDRNDQEEIKTMLTEDFCSRLFNQSETNVAPAFDMASKKFLD